MTRLRKIVLGIAGVLLLVVVVAFVRARIERAGKPQFEGRTAEEWIVRYSRNVSASSGHRPGPSELQQLEIAFRTMGPEAHSELIREVLAYKRVTPFLAKLSRVKDELPDSLRFSFMIDPRSRTMLSRQVLNLIRPKWDTFAPLVQPALSSGDTNRLGVVLDLLGNVGEGASNAVPILVGALTNHVGRIPLIAMQSLCDLGTNALPALPFIIRDLEQRRWNDRHLLVLRQLGSEAGDAVPDLEKLLAMSVSSKGDEPIAATLITINPQHEEATARLRLYLANEARASTDSWRLLSPLYDVRAPNSTAAGLIEQFATDTQWEPISIQMLLEHNPEKAVAILHDQLNRGMDRTSALWLLLQHDPYDPVVLEFLRGKIADPFFPRGRLANAWISPLEHCLSDSPGVLKMLDQAEQSSPPAPLLEAINTVRRHIELNDQLKKLRVEQQ